MNDLFLCHTGVDKDWVRSLGERLEGERIGDRLIKVFFDEWDIDFGHNIIAQIDRGLKESRFVGLVLSPAMLRAPWPTAEWQSQVMDDPSGKTGRILPILLKKFDPENGAPLELPFVLKTLKRFDFTDEKKFEVELAQLLRRLTALPPQRGKTRGGLGSAIGSQPSGQEAPDSVEEALPSNLFPVLSVPDVLYSDVTNATTYADVWRTYKGSAPPFFLHEGRLYSFIHGSAADNPFRAVQAKTNPREDFTANWMATPSGSRQIIGLMNAGLREHCYRLSIRTPKAHRQHYYCPIFQDGSTRRFTWGKGRERTLATMAERPDKSKFGVHMCANMRFFQLGAKLSLLIEPAWMFTSDGVTALGGKEAGLFSTKWGGRERNAAVLRNVLMWGLLVAEGQPEIIINVGTPKVPARVVVRSVPLHTRINVGLAEDRIRLDRILSGEGAGERREAHADAGTSEADERDELLKVADLALLGVIDDDESVEDSHDTTEDEADAEEEPPV